jgi:hypothetical protein
LGDTHLESKGEQAGEESMKKAALLLTVLLFLPACGTIHFDVPEGKRVRLLPRDAPTTVRVVQPIWYVGWGAKPLGSNHTAPIIEDHNLKEVKLYNQQSLTDSILNTFTVFLSFSRRTMIVEGNPAEEAVQ